MTPLFREWRARHPRHRSAALRYFDNFPTAAVTTRAERLQRYLVKRIARGDIVGHHRRVAAVGPSRRRFHTYDLLASTSGFGDEVFHEVWEDVFEFCCE